MSENKNIQNLLNKNKGFTTPNTISNIKELEDKLTTTNSNNALLKTDSVETKSEDTNEMTSEIKTEIVNSLSDEKLQGNTTITLAFKKEHKKILQEHFESEGIINYSTGIRSVLLRYMKAKKLI